MKKVTKAVIPAAGLGTRVLPATKAMPKHSSSIFSLPGFASFSSSSGLRSK